MELKNKNRKNLHTSPGQHRGISQNPGKPARKQTNQASETRKLEANALWKPSPLAHSIEHNLTPFHCSPGAVRTWQGAVVRTGDQTAVQAARAMQSHPSDQASQHFTKKRNLKDDEAEDHDKYRKSFTGRFVLRRLRHQSRTLKELAPRTRGGKRNQQTSGVFGC